MKDLSNIFPNFIGKSTVINALIGATILPSNNVPETARIVAVEHTRLDGHQKPFLTYQIGKDTVKVEGEQEICENSKGKL